MAAEDAFGGVGNAGSVRVCGSFRRRALKSLGGIRSWNADGVSGPGVKRKFGKQRAEMATSFSQHSSGGGDLNCDYGGLSGDYGGVSKRG